MGIITEIAEDWDAALAALVWQMELGATEAILDQPLDRYALAGPTKSEPVVAARAPAQRHAPLDPAPVQLSIPDAAVTDALAAAARAATLDDLRDALAGFGHCELKRGARNLVFADGNRAARVLVLGEAPGREEDVEGRPFVGRAGQLLNQMFAAIGLSRQSADPASALYITNVLPWRPPQDRDPTPEEIAMMRPFVERHVALINPEVIVLMGATALQTVMRQTGILRARGIWTRALGKPVLPMAHPAYLLRNPAAKREAWADLLALKAWLRDGPTT